MVYPATATSRPTRPRPYPMTPSRGRSSRSPAPQPPAPRKAKFGERAEWRPILPEHLQSWPAARKHYGWHARKARHHFLYHLVRVPARIWHTLRWAALGLLKLGWLQVNWWWVTEQTYLRMQAVADNDARTWESLHKHAVKRRAFRGGVLAAELAALLVLIGTVTAYAPLAMAAYRPGRGAAAGVDRPSRRQADPHLGRRAGGVRDADDRGHRPRPGRPAPGRDEQGAGQGPDKAIVLIDPIQRDGPGWLARLDLPHGVTAGEVTERREELAVRAAPPARLRVARDDHKRHPGALNLYVGDEDMTTAEQPAWPLASAAPPTCSPRWCSAPTRAAGRSRSRSCSRRSSSASIPRMGKTFLLRLLLLICALDLRRRAPRLRPQGHRRPGAARPVAHRYRAGDDPEDIEYLVADFRALRTEMRRRTKVIRGLDETRCPENKVTPELANDPRLGLHPIVIAVDECQVAVRAPGVRQGAGGDLHRPGQARPRARHHADAGHPAARRQVHPDRHQRERRAADVPEGDGPGRERHGARHLDVQERDPRHHVRLRGQGRRSTSRARGSSPVIMRGYGFDCRSPR